MSRTGLLAIVLAAGLAGCVRRDGLNDACEWPQESAAPLDLATTAHARHLAADAAFAEALGIRHARAPAAGGESAEARIARGDRCVARLVNWIAVLHGVTPADVERARAHREHSVDAVAVFAPMAVALGTLAAFAGLGIGRRVPAVRGVAALGATLVAAIAIALVILATGELWSWLVEIVRVGDSHLGTRALRLPWPNHRVAILAVGTLAAWALTGWGYRRALRGPAGAP